MIPRIPFFIHAQFMGNIIELMCLQPLRTPKIEVGLLNRFTRIDWNTFPAGI